LEETYFAENERNKTALKNRNNKGKKEKRKSENRKIETQKRKNRI